MTAPTQGEVGPASPSGFVAKRGPSERRFGLFPLPSAPLSSSVSSALSSRDRAQIRTLVDDAAQALNWMHGETYRPRTAAGNRQAETRKGMALHTSVQQRLEERAQLLLIASSALALEDALRTILKGRSVYSTSAGTSTAPYQSTAVSMPASVEGSPFLEDILPPSERGVLVGYKEHMLRSKRDLEALREIEGVPNCYHDPVLASNRRKYIGFVRQCVQSGLVHYETKCGCE